MTITVRNYKQRRKEFVSKLPENSVVIIPNKSVSIRSNDVEYSFKPDSDFYYLTGFDEPDSICVLKKDKRTYTYILFVKPRDKEKEIWVGKSAGLEGARKNYGADEAYPLSQYSEYIKKIVQGQEYIYFPLGKNKEQDQIITRLVGELRSSNRTGIKTAKAVCDPRELLHKMRLIKDHYEISCIQKACDISKNAHIMAMTYAKDGMFEYEIEALIEYRFKASGAGGSAYPSIVGSGNNSTVLHYTQNKRRIKKNDLILIDAGSEYNYYASDLTRTFPVNKKFNSIQKDVYEIVLEAQTKAIELIKPGRRFVDAYDKSVLVLSEGLKELGLLKGSISEIIKKGKYKKFFMHKLSHWLGLDVHDAGPYADSKGDSIKLVPGMILTVEPGIYIASHLNVPDRFKGIGIRIEDDVLLTKNGNKILTDGAPKSINEIEAFG